MNIYVPVIELAGSHGGSAGLVASPEKINVNWALETERDDLQEIISSAWHRSHPKSSEEK